MQNILGFLVLTHSSRRTDLTLCSRDSLAHRYSAADRLRKVPDFTTLPPISEFECYSGGLTIYKLGRRRNTGITVKDLGYLKTKKKIQHAIILEPDRILIVYESSVELWKLKESLNTLRRLNNECFMVEKKYENRLFAGLHTAARVSENLVVLSASAPDAILLLDIVTGHVKKMLRMPKEYYGSNYDITREMDLREHYIYNDLQVAHINCAYAVNKNEILVSALIPGCIGRFNLATEAYSELVTGYIGCHGVRVTDTGDIYFSDSTGGELIFIDSNGEVVRKFSLMSRWLHDSIHIIDDIYAISVADRNELRLIDLCSGDILFNKKYHGNDNPSKQVNKIADFLSQIFPGMYRGSSTQFLSFYKIAEAVG